MSQQVFSSAVKGKKIPSLTFLIVSFFRSAPVLKLELMESSAEAVLDLVLIYPLKEKSGYTGTEADVYEQALKIE